MPSFGRGGVPAIDTAMRTSGVHTVDKYAQYPVEALERAFPMKVLRSRLRRGSGGAGRCPGGEGIERDLLMLEDGPCR